MDFMLVIVECLFVESLCCNCFEEWYGIIKFKLCEIVIQSFFYIVLIMNLGFCLGIYLNYKGFFRDFFLCFEVFLVFCYVDLIDNFIYMVN